MSAITTTRQRLELLARAYPRLFPHAGLPRLLRDQLGHPDALDRWVERSGIEVRARAPRQIYHVCAGNLAVSAITSLAQGLLLGARNVVKLPSDRDDATTRRDILRFIRSLPAPLRALVKAESVLDSNSFAASDVIVAFGTDAAMHSLRARTRWNQRFIAHGPAVSLLWLADPDRLTTRAARACATDVLTYDQLGCLSPQAIYLPRGAKIDPLGDKLALALESNWRKLAAKPPRPLAVTARIAEAREVAHALGHRVWLPPRKHFGWTLIHDPDPAFTASPLHGVIYLRAIASGQLETALAPVRGFISTVGVAGKLSSRLREAFLSLGVSRFCAAGRMQTPPLTWRHDGRATLGEMVTWVDAEPSA